MSDEEMPFLLMLQEANAMAGVAGDPDPARPTKTVGPQHGPSTKSAAPSRSARACGHRPPADDAVQMTPELWQRGNYLHRLNNEFSLDLSQPMALRVLGEEHNSDAAEDAAKRQAPAPYSEFDDVPLDFADETQGLAGTDQLPFLATKLLSHARASLASQSSILSEVESVAPSEHDHGASARNPNLVGGRLDASEQRFASLENNDDDAATPPHGDSEIVLDSFALQALAVRTRPTGMTAPIASPVFRHQGGGGGGSDDNHRDAFASLSDDNGDVTPPSIEHAAADVALRVLEGEGSPDLAAEFDRQMLAHYDADGGPQFGHDLEQALQHALRPHKKHPQPARKKSAREPIRQSATLAAMQLAHDVSIAELDEVALSAIASIANEYHQRPIPDETDPSLLSEEHSPFVDEEWQFAETVNAGSNDVRGSDVHELSTEIGLHPSPPRPRRAVRSRRRPRRGRSVLAERRQPPAAESTNPRRSRLPWESLGSSALLDSGWEAPDSVPRSHRVEEIDAFDDETVPISHPDERAAHRRARELFLGAVAHYRAGRLSAAHADALLACVFDPENPTYKTMTTRWSEELSEHHPY